MRMIFWFVVQPGVELFVASQRRSTFARIVGGAMRACCGENHRTRSFKTRASLMAAIMGEGLITANHSAVFRFTLFRGEGLSDHAAEGDGAAAAVAGRHIRIRVGVVRARVDARDVQALNRLAVVVDGLEVFVNRNAVERAQHVARSANAIERRRANRRRSCGAFASPWSLVRLFALWAP